MIITLQLTPSGFILELEMLAKIKLINLTLLIWSNLKVVIIKE